MSGPSKRQLKLRQRDKHKQVEAAKAKGGFPNQTVFRASERLYRPLATIQGSLTNYPELLAHPHPALVPLGTLALSAFSSLQVPAYALPSVPGLIYLPQALPPKLQAQLVHEALLHYPRAPNKTNLHAHYHLPSESIFHAHLEDPDLQVQSIDPTTTTTSSIPISSLIRKLRWTTLGRQYDWSTKSYPDHQEIPPFPSTLDQISRSIAQVLPAPFSSSHYTPQAGVVNYYHVGDTLTGHVDQSEENMDAPLISLSLGCSSVFLIGPDAQTTPAALLLRSGDVLAMCGSSRSFLHGIPSILPTSSPSYLTDPATYLQGVSEAEEASACTTYIQNARINMNVRQVFY
ncbi:MAG: hypothetical protein DHS80DRAFT_19853 [Piptocephalis tieghemiana]|nr:MAG: hypothetical protein DHS80DRAFT_19853 [Piptocephalis tieghemiana]